MKIMEMLHKKNPYAEYKLNHGEIKPFHQGWHGDNHFIHQTIHGNVVWNNYSKDPLIIEVGSWLGQSAINMAEAGKNCPPLRIQKRDMVSEPEIIERKLEIVCVDTWLGAEEFWDPTDIRYEWLNLVDGYPSCYEQFIQNVIDKQCEDIITPFPIGSLQAAEWFKKKGIQADAIYIDAGHSYDSVIADIKAWWPILKQGGIMFGDDLIGPFDGVSRAVTEFFGGTYSTSSDGIFWMRSK